MAAYIKRLASNPRRILILILAFSVLTRLMMALYLGNSVRPLPGIADQESYHNLAVRVLEGHGFSFAEQWWPATRANEPTAHWSFLYTLYLAAVYALVGISPFAARLIQAVTTGILLPWFVYRLSLLLLLPRPGEAGKASSRGQAEAVGLLAAAIASGYAYFIYYGAALMTESFYIVAILWSFDVVIRMAQSHRPGWSSWIWLGVALGTAVLLRQLFLLMIPFLLLWLWWALRPRLWRLVIPLGIVVLMMLPWMIRNYLAFDHFVLLNTNSGFAFYWGNHPVHGTHFLPIIPLEKGSYYSLIPPELLYLNEAKLDSALLQLGIQGVLADPWRYILLSISRIPPYFEFWPLPDSHWVANFSRVGSFGIMLPFMLVGMIMVIRRPAASWHSRLASPWALLFLFMLVYTGIHVLTWTLIRYRLPVDAFLVIFAGVAAHQLGLWLLRRRTAP